MAAERLSVAVLSPEGMVFEGDADMVVAPAWDGEVGILRGHAPMIVLMGSGRVRIQLDDREEQFLVSGGFLQVVDDRVTLLSERAEPDTA